MRAPDVDFLLGAAHVGWIVTKGVVGLGGAIINGIGEAGFMMLAFVD